MALQMGMVVLGMELPTTIADVAITVDQGRGVATAMSSYGDIGQDNGNFYFSQMYPSMHAELLSALKRGHGFELRTPFFVANGTLRGAAAAISAVEASCPFTEYDPAFESLAASERASKPLEKSPTAEAPIIEPAIEGDIPDMFRWYFETNDCVATENELAQLVTERYDMWTANIAIVNWTKSDEFRQNYRLISRAPFTYRYLGSEICSRE
ncbi:hypothetical protein [Psychromarinibacter halotolerans]|uniref:Uncharacterized protein n=1 Tax=Psychromarinibacter halotolerans TaxID=1775175 RepID=A0ABV7GPT7_9RHOB|nr:hypothetical protein [Psychromarinibacter halotolerans]MDF0594693.1 hypothetical protein [Psychromarinibacter halotolerans]